MVYVGENAVREHLKKGAFIQPFIVMTPDTDYLTFMGLAYFDAQRVQFYFIIFNSKKYVF